MRLLPICGDGRAAAPALWVGALGQLLGGPHFAGLPSRVFQSIPKLPTWSFLYVNQTCGPPFVLILITPARNRQSPKLVEFYQCKLLQLDDILVIVLSHVILTVKKKTYLPSTNSTKLTFCSSLSKDRLNDRSRIATMLSRHTSTHVFKQELSSRLE